jgi:hypothetical protein
MLSSSKVTDKLFMREILTIAVKSNRKLGHDILKGVSILTTINKKSYSATFENRSVNFL